MMTGSCVMNQEYWLETVGVLFDTIIQLKREVWTFAAVSL